MLVFVMGNVFRETEFELNCWIYSFIWGFMSLSTLYRSYHDG